MSANLKICYRYSIMKQVLPVLFFHLLSLGLFVICINGAQKVDINIYGLLAGITLWPVIETGWATFKEIRALVICERYN